MLLVLYWVILSQNVYALSFIPLGLQMAQSRYYLQTFDPKVGTICILGALGYWVILSQNV